MASFECTGILPEEIQIQTFKLSTKVIIQEPEVFVREPFISYSLLKIRHKILLCQLQKYNIIALLPSLLHEKALIVKE